MLVIAKSEGLCLRVLSALQIALMITPSPLAHQFGQSAGIRAEFFPYAAPLQFGRHAESRRVHYRHDIGFSGGWQKLSGVPPQQANSMPGAMWLEPNSSLITRPPDCRSVSVPQARILRQFHRSPYRIRGTCLQPR